MVPTPSEPNTTEHPLLKAAAPVCQAIAAVTRSEPLTRRSDLRDRLRKTMASAVSCMRAASRSPGAESVPAHLAGAERLVQSVLEDLCFAYEDGFLTDEQYTEVFGGCASLCRQLRERRDEAAAYRDDSVAAVS
jgi:hypothetical protein